MLKPNPERLKFRYLVSMVSVWAMRFTSATSSSILSHLVETETLEVTLSTVGPQHFEDHIQMLGPDCEVLLTNQLVFPPESVRPNVTLPGWLDGSAANDLAALQVLDRNEPYDSAIPLNDRLTLLGLQRDFWDTKLSQCPPDVVIFANDPHLYFEHVLLGLLNARKIPHLTIRPTGQGFHCFINERAERMRIPGSLPLEKVIDGMRDEISKSGYVYGAHERAMKQIGWPTLIRTALTRLAALVRGGFWRSYELGYYIIPVPHSRFRFPTLFEQRLIEARTAIRILWSRIFYDLMSSRELPDGEYIYLALPSRYENSNIPPLSPHTLESVTSAAIRTAVSSGIQVVVREHPGAFKFRQHTRFGHKTSFYRWMAQFTNLRLLSLRTNQLEAIKGAAEVWTTGWSSTLIEALMVNRPVRVIGRQGAYGQGFDAEGFFRGAVRDWGDPAEFARRIRQAVNLSLRADV